MTRAALVAVAALALVLALPAAEARAHQVNFSRGDYRPSPGGAEAWITFARPDLIAVLPELDADGDGKLADAEIKLDRGVTEKILGLLTGTRGAETCASQVVELSPTEQDGGMFVVRFGPCEGSAGELKIHLGMLLKAVATGHRHTAFVYWPGEAKPRDMILHGEGAEVTVPIGAGDATPSAANPDGASSPRAARGPGSSFGRGFAALFVNASAALFVAGLALVSAPRRDLLRAALAFGVGAASAAALTGFGWIDARPSTLFALAALSVAYLGFENLVARSHEWRWASALAFGLVHGSMLGATRGGLAPAWFTLGLACAALALGAACTALSSIARARWSRAAAFDRLASGAIMIAGLFLFYRRLRGR